MACGEIYSRRGTKSPLVQTVVSCQNIELTNADVEA